MAGDIFISQGQIGHIYRYSCVSAFPSQYELFENSNQDLLFYGRSWFISSSIIVVSRVSVILFNFFPASEEDSAQSYTLKKKKK